MAIGVPEIGQWYRTAGHALLEIVAVDELDGTIEIQYFDGTIEELEPEAWYALLARPAEAPEDWSGSVDISIEDFNRNYSSHGVDWMSELDSLDMILDSEPLGTD